MGKGGEPKDFQIYTTTVNRRDFISLHPTHIEVFMEQLNSIDGLFASLFLTACIAANGYLIYTIVQLPNERDIRTLFNCMIPRRYIAIFFMLMMIPAYFFHVRAMSYSAGMIFITAVLASFAFDKLRLRAKTILRGYRFI